MGVGVALHPGFVLARREGGISEYGVHVKTAVLYTLAWVVLAVGNMRAARACAGRGVRSEKVRKLTALLQWGLPLGACQHLLLLP